MNTLKPVNGQIDAAVAACVNVVYHDKTIKKAIAFLNPHFVVKATAQNSNARRANERGVTILVTIGKPNYDEREFIASCIKAKEPFPIEKIQVTHATKKRKA